MKILRNYFKGWNWFELSVLIAAFIVPPVVGIIVGSSILEILAPMFGMMVAILYAKAKFEAFPLTFVSVGLYVILAWQSGIFSEVIYMLAVLMPLTIYGLINWKRNQRKDDAKGQVTVLRGARGLELLILAIVLAVASVGIYFFLRWFETEHLIISTASLITGTAAMYLITRRFKWALAVHILYSASVIVLWMLFIVPDNWNMVVVLLNPIIFITCDIYGTFHWRRLEKRQAGTQSDPAPPAT